MPVEIRELVIRAIAHKEGESAPSPGQRPSGGEDREAIVAAAVREVLRILRAAKER
jgi:hypothetical protein